MNKNDLSHIRAVLFDLDGTLLQVEMSDFIPRYIDGLSDAFIDLISAKKFKKIFLGGIRELIRGQAGGATNEERLLSVLKKDLPITVQEFRARLETFGEQRADSLANMVSAIPEAKAAVECCLLRGQTLVLATNPVFPMFMVDARRRWSGLSDTRFDHVTSYENSCYCKPNRAYYEEIADTIGVSADQCLMIGNDANHDLAAMGAGMTTYLVDTYLVERSGHRWPSDYRGNHSQLLAFLQDHLPRLVAE